MTNDESKRHHRDLAGIFVLGVLMPIMYLTLPWDSAIPIRLYPWGNEIVFCFLCLMLGVAQWTVCSRRPRLMPALVACLTMCAGGVVGRTAGTAVLAMCFSKPLSFLGSTAFWGFLAKEVGIVFAWLAYVGFASVTYATYYSKRAKRRAAF